MKVFSAKSFATIYIVPYIKQFIKEYPSIELDLHFAERIPDLHKEAIDLSIGLSTPLQGEIIQKRIMTTSYVICASPAYLQSFGVPRTAVDLKKHRYITHTMRKPDNELFISGEYISLTPYARVNDAEAMLQLALDGVGVISVHKYVAEKFLQRKELQSLLPSYPKERVPIYLAYPTRKYISCKTRSFIDFIQNQIEKKDA